MLHYCDASSSTAYMGTHQTLYANILHDITFCLLSLEVSRRKCYHKFRSFDVATLFYGYVLRIHIVMVT